jgi:hypothetical protein
MLYAIVVIACYALTGAALDTIGSSTLPPLMLSFGAIGAAFSGARCALCASC